MRMILERQTRDAYLAAISSQRPIIDENGQPIAFESLSPTMQKHIAQIAVAEEAHKRYIKEHHPETDTPDFGQQLVQSVMVLKTKFEARSCSCCLGVDGVDMRGSYRVCRRCAVSVDRCGMCILHNSIVFREELKNNPRPTLDDVLDTLGEPDDAIDENRPRLRGADGKLPPEPD